MRYFRRYFSPVPRRSPRAISDRPLPSSDPSKSKSLVSSLDAGEEGGKGDGEGVCVWERRLRYDFRLDQISWISIKMPGIKINKYHSVSAAARRRALTYNNINNNNACACHRQRERGRERVASARGRTVPGLSARQIEDHHRSKSAFATKLIVKLPLIMFCVLWLVHMIDSPLLLPPPSLQSSSFHPPLLRPCPQRKTK